jgi:hypothetical protein
MNKLTLLFIRLAYWLHIRVPWSLIVRAICREKERTPLNKFNTPQELADYLKAKFQYRYDPDLVIVFGPVVIKEQGAIDYVSHPEYFQWKLENPGGDGDCDDFHWYAANALKTIAGVEKVYYLSSGFIGGGHATAVYKYQGSWFHLDYKIYPLVDPNEAPKGVAERYTKKGKPVQVTYWVWENVGETGYDRRGWTLNAIAPAPLDTTK